ncbi:MAG: hypothetical protein DCC58_11885 [Chloroflexi bacterium]|nr:MAG: hypothetical protein DCC58_11885 [Chloroflexota bacterium]
MTTVAPAQHQHLHQRNQFVELALALVAARGVDDLLAAAPTALATALGNERRYRVIEARDDEDTSAGWPVPLVRDGRRVGTLLVEGESLPDAALLSPVCDLLAAALAARRQVADEQARALKEAAELKFDTVAMLSHEMRTPLASIKGYATALLLPDAAWDDATRTEFLEAIDAESDRLTALIEDILESAAIEAGVVRLELEPVLLPRLAARVIERISIQSSRHRFLVTFPPEFPAVVADAQRIEQVLTNLLDNAVKYSPGGGLVVVRGDVCPGEVVVRVVDQGIGIAPEDVNKLFERFFRVARSRSEGVGGTGLGLPISDAIVRAHGGRIWAESVVGSGTTLAFTLPHPRAGEHV